MNEELNNVGNQPAPTQETGSTSVETTENVVDEQVQAPKEQEKLYNKQQVIELMKKRVERSHNSFFKRYGVENLQGLDDLFDKANEYQRMNDEYAKLKMLNDDLTQQNSFLRNNINFDKINDIKAFFKGSDIEFSEDELIKQLATHPEWLKPSIVPTTTIKTFGLESKGQPKEDEDAKMKRIFNI